MVDFTGSRPGQIDLDDSDNTALFLKVFGGEVLTAFDTKTVLKERTYTRVIQSGKSAQFPATWKATASYHVPGTQLTGGNQIRAGERIINIDALLQSNVFIANIDEAMSHFEVRSIYSHQLGEALANQYDKNLLIVSILAAREAADTIFTGHPGGTVVKNTSAATDGEVLAGLVFDAVQALDEKDAPDDSRWVVLRPAQYYLLAQTVKVLNKDWGGSGSYADGNVLRLAGVEIVKSNNIPSTNIASSPVGTTNTYHGNFTDTVGVVGSKGAIGTVQLLDLATESEYKVDYQGTLIVAKYAVGHGILRPELSVEISKAA